MIVKISLWKTLPKKDAPFIIKKHSPHKNLSEKERELFHTLGDISQADTKSLKEDIHNEAKEILSNTETVQELKDYVEEHLSIDEEVIHQNINILQEQQEESKSTESSKGRPIEKSNINNNEVK